jgi:hypothetical protein
MRARSCRAGKAGADTARLGGAADLLLHNEQLCTLMLIIPAVIAAHDAAGAASAPGGSFACWRGWDAYVIICTILGWCSMACSLHSSSKSSGFICAPHHASTRSLPAAETSEAAAAPPSLSHGCERARRGGAPTFCRSILCLDMSTTLTATSIPVVRCTAEYTFP